MKKMNIITSVFLSFLLMGCGAKETAIKWQVEDTQVSVEQQEMTAVEGAVEETATLSYVYVYVCGAIQNPGVYEVPEGSRLYEVLEHAGGMLEEADDMYLNLAREVKDGEQIVILTSEQTKTADGSILTEQAVGVMGLVNINTASVEELTSLNGIGESRARAIIAYREKNGAFASVDSIMQVVGIKEALFAKIKDKITV